MSGNHPNFRPPETFSRGINSTIILVDYSNLLYRAWFVASRRRNIAMAKFFDILRVCIRRCTIPGVPVGVIFCGETPKGHKLRRKKLNKDYKGNRKGDDEKLTEFKQSLSSCITDLGYTILQHPGAEADDVIATLAKQWCEQDTGTEVVIFSSDRDLQQCLEYPNCYIYRAPGKFVTKETFIDEMHFTPKKFIVYKSLVGDKSDNIKGVEGWGPVRSTNAIVTRTVARDIYAEGPRAISEFKAAMELVKLDKDLKLANVRIHFGPPIFDETKISKKYDEKVSFEIKRLIADFTTEVYKC